MQNTAILRKKILSLADHCVKCGLCSSQCPTYLLKQDENESPRGRIALAQALASNAMPGKGKLTEHLNNCLQCRRCEAVCPSQVKYGDLIAATHVLLNAENQQSQRIYTHFIKYVSSFSHQTWQKWATIVQFFNRSGLMKLINVSKHGKKINEYLLNSSNSLEKNHLDTQNTENRNKVFLFTGCLSHIFDQQTLKISLSLLKLSGYQVKIPSKQTCCGAIAAREGLSEIEDQCQLDNLINFSDADHSPILFFTTGCGVKLSEYKEQLPTKISFEKRAIDITEFLINSELFAKLSFSPLKKKVLIFNPCSAQNTLKQDGVMEKLLSHIPNIEIINLPKTTGCCGASGTHTFTHSQQANQIRAPILDQIITLSPDIIVSPNYPCNLHIQSGLRKKGMDIPMIHPIELMYKNIKV